jgi:hypothetical protein
MIGNTAGGNWRSRSQPEGNTMDLLRIGLALLRLPRIDWRLFVLDWSEAVFLIIGFGYILALIIAGLAADHFPEAVQ